MTLTPIARLLGLLAASAALAAAEPAPIRVGITPGGQHKTLIAQLNAQPGFRAFQVDAVTDETSESLDVLVVTHSDNPGPLNRSARTLRNTVRSGKGALFLHDAVGYGRHFPLFREIGRGTHAPLLDQFKIVTAHPVTQDITPGVFFKQGFEYDHVAIEPGPRGTVLAVDAEGAAVAVAGTSGEGRVVLIGMAVGGSVRIPGPIEDDRTDRGGVPKPPKDGELALFLNAIRWLGEQDGS